jgi:hypothetical protein
MKRIIFLIAIMLLLIGCTEVHEEEQVTTPTEDYELQKYEITDSKDNVKLYSIILTEYGPEPDYIEANLGDTIKLEVINDINADVYYNTETIVEEYVIPSPDPPMPDTTGYNEVEVTTVTTSGIDVRFIIYEYKVDKLLEKLGVIDITLVLDKVGTFTFGDDTENIPKGTLVVN